MEKKVRIKERKKRDGDSIVSYLPSPSMSPSTGEETSPRNVKCV